MTARTTCWSTRQWRGCSRRPDPSQVRVHPPGVLREYHFHNALSKIVATSSNNSFEFDDVAYAQVPEPASGALLVFGLLSGVLFRSSQQHFRKDLEFRPFTGSDALPHHATAGRGLPPHFNGSPQPEVPAPILTFRFILSELPTARMGRLCPDYQMLRATQTRSKIPVMRPSRFSSNKHRHLTHGSLSQGSAQVKQCPQGPDEGLPRGASGVLVGVQGANDFGWCFVGC